ncbi:rRNA methylase [Bernardetia litoralis DSM 6794]|uniref:rRNA methylase n=1 Tax=Bernardetia litoralis (strain ATCC 23117 / DSM 6794 / NBRC 15988 / NCIMB 1366 / Fx l1 / Sio-4) TaxID=880071 RepID=I4AHN5_BERLS|nr:RNA methyltransferase [Bernardetia litoralis]AFM03470.1 rRNA methylase [Bernardetia litoralis DSM 6794]
MTNTQRKFLRSLQQKKERKNTNSFLIEGKKIVTETFQATNSEYKIKQLFATQNFLDNQNILNSKVNEEVEIILSTSKQLSEAGSLKSNNAAIAVVEIPTLEVPKKLENLALLLENINDPGNLGTIIRIADWYGIEDIFCSEQTVDLYNSKTLSSTMGSFLRVNVHYGNEFEFLKLAEGNTFGAFLDGKNVHQTKFPKTGILVIGSESHGISEKLGKEIMNKVTIPSFAKEQESAESLNAAIATAIICDNWRRN